MCTPPCAPTGAGSLDDDDVHSHWLIGVFKWEYVNTVVTFQICTYFKNYFIKAISRALLQFLPSLILTLRGLGEFLKVMQTLDYV